jgi:hypothetical protein
MEADLTTLNQKLKQLTAEMALLKAQQSRGATRTSPWLPLKEAASRLNFRSARALKNRIKNGQFPPDCYCLDPTTSKRVTRYLVHVERYIKKLR